MSWNGLPYKDRSPAARPRAAQLTGPRAAPGPLVLGLPRGGVPVAHEVAKALGAPLDVFIVRKLGYPSHPEFAMGAIASGGVRVMKVLPGMRPSDQAIGEVVADEMEGQRRRGVL